MLRTRSPLLFGALAASLAGCSISFNTGEDAKQAPPPPQARPAPPGQRAPAPPPARRRPPVPATATRLTSPNAFGNGKAGAFQGLAYVLPENTQRIPPLSGMVPFAALYTDSFEIQPQEFSNGFPGALIQNDWFLIHYEGAFNVPRNGTWQFRVISDDGAILYVDDKRVVNNDGVHTPKTADGQLALTAGSHWLRLDYFQASKGQVALSVLMGQNGQFAPLKGTP